MNPRPIPTTFMPLTPRLRRRIEDTIEQLVALLDALDGDPDFEPAGDDEPSIGWTWSFDGTPVLPAADAGDDRERDEADDEDGADSEPSLGWRQHSAGAGYQEDLDDREREESFP